MSKITAKQQEKIDNAKRQKLDRTIRAASTSSDTATFSCKVDSYTVERFKDGIDKFNEKNPTKKIKIGKLVEQLLWDFTQELKEINAEEEQQELDLGE